MKSTLINQTKNYNPLTNQNYILSTLFSFYLSLPSFYKTNFFFGYFTNKLFLVYERVVNPSCTLWIILSFS